MSEHLKWAKAYLQVAEDSMKPTVPLFERQIYSTVKELLLHLEAQNPPAETQQSETLSALTHGPVVKRYGSAIASLDSSRGQFHLTVETGDCSKSILFTWQEWAAIRQLCLTPQPTSEWPTPSTETVTAGGRGVANHEPGVWDHDSGTYTPASTSPVEDASREGREAVEDFANDLCVNLDIEPFSEDGERMQAAVIRTWTEQGYPHGGPR